MFSPKKLNELFFLILVAIFLVLFSSNVFAATCGGLGYIDWCTGVDPTKCISGNPYECKAVGAITKCYVKLDTCTSTEKCIDPWGTTGAHCECNPTNLKASTACYDSDEYYYDNCGNLQTKKTECSAGTTYSSNYCSGSKVVKDKTVKGCSGSSCTSSTTTVDVETCGANDKCSAGKCIAKTCSDWGYSNSCTGIDPTKCISGNPFECISVGSTKCYSKLETCSSTERCVDPWGTTGAHCECNPTDLTANTACYNDDVYYYDNCWGLQTKKTECNSGTTYSSNYCSGDTVVRDKTVNGCSGAACTTATTYGELVQTCGTYDKCSAGKCVAKTCKELGYYDSCIALTNTICADNNPFECKITSSGNWCYVKTDTCGSGEYCNDPPNLTGAQCFTSGCYNSNVYYFFKSDGSVSELKENCLAANKFCSNGACITQKCVPKSKQCISDSVVEVCKDDGSGTEQITCKSYEKCSEGSCINKSCKEQGHLDSCIKLTNTICSENNPYECKITTSGNWCYVKTETCGTGEYCFDPPNLTGAQCFTASCYNNDVYYYFKTDGTRSNMKEDCPSYSGCLNGICVDGSITAASWSRTLVMVGDPVKMVANFTGVDDGTKVTFKVLEYDIWRNQSTGIEVQSEVTNGVAEASITVPALKDLISNAEIKFKVFITDKPTITKTSELLTIYYDPKVVIDLYDEQVQSGYIGQVLWSVSSGDENITGVDFGNSTSRMCYPYETETSNCYKRTSGALLEENIYYALFYPKTTGKMYLRAYAIMNNQQIVYSDWKSLDIYDDNSSKIGLWFKKIDLEDISNGGVEIAKALTVGNCINDGLWTWGCGLDTVLLIPIGKLIKLGTSLKLTKGADVIKSIDTLEDISKYSLEVKMKGTKYAKAGAELLEAHNLKIITFDKTTGLISTSYDNLAEYVLKNSIAVPKNLLAKGLLKNELESFIVKGIDLGKIDAIASKSAWARPDEVVSILRGLNEAKGSAFLKETIDNWDNVAKIGIVKPTANGKYVDLYLSNVAGRELSIEAKGIDNILTDPRKLRAALSECGAQLEMAWGEKIAVVKLRADSQLTMEQISKTTIDWLNDATDYGPAVNKVVIEKISMGTGIIERTVFSKNEIIGAVLLSKIYVYGVDQVGTKDISEVLPSICTSFTYSDWNTCIDGSQFRKVVSSFPSGCVGGAPVFSKACSSTIVCSSNSQCGTDAWVGPAFCQNNNVMKLWKTYTCNYSGTIDSYCSSVNVLKQNQTCTNGCTNGVCNPEVCISNWSCTSWGSCSNYSQTRTCTDLTNCSVPTNKPSTNKNCYPNCLDSDNGNNPFVKSTSVSGIININGKLIEFSNISETCVDASTVLESDCTYDSALGTKVITQTNIKCMNGCFNGACASFDVCDVANTGQLRCNTDLTGNWVQVCKRARWVNQTKCTNACTNGICN